MVRSCMRQLAEHPTHFLPPPVRSGRCSSTTRAPEAERRRASRLPAEAEARGIEPVELVPGDGHATRSCATRWRAVRTRWRWPAATGRSRSWPRSPRSTRCRMHACRPEPETTSRSTSVSTATTSSARSTPLSTAPSASSTWPTSTAGSSSTTSRSGSTARPFSGPATGTRSCARSSRRSLGRRSARPPKAELRWTEPGRQPEEGPPDVAGLQQPLPPRRAPRLAASAPRLDEGVLGILVLGEPHARPALLRSPSGWRTWTAPSFAVESGLDGARGRRRRGRAARAAAPIPDEARRAEGADRAPSSRGGGALLSRDTPMTPRWAPRGWARRRSRLRRHHADADAEPG